MRIDAQHDHHKNAHVHSRNGLLVIEAFENRA